MPVGIIEIPRQPVTPASGMPPLGPLSQPQSVSNPRYNPIAPLGERSTGKPGTERGVIELPLTGIDRRKLQELEQKLSHRALTDSELSTLIASDFGRTPIGSAMAHRLVADALQADLPLASKQEREVWEAIVEDAITMPVDLWCTRHANPPPEVVRPATSPTLKALAKVLKERSPAPASWRDVFPDRPAVSSRVAELRRVARDATLDTAAVVRHGGGKTWVAAVLGSLLLAAGLPAAQAEDGLGAEDEAEGQVPLLRQHLVNVAAPMLGSLARLGSLVARYPRAATCTAATTMALGITAALYGRPSDSGSNAANTQALPFASLAGAVSPEILAHVIDEVRHGDASLDPEQLARRAVRALGPAADGVQLVWKLAQHGRTDRLQFMPPDLDLEFGRWLIKQVWGDPVPPGGIDMTWSTWTLPNGLRVILVPGKGDMASVQLRFGDGSAIEREGQHGAVHFAEHLWFRRNLPGEQRFEDLFSAAGVKYNAYTSLDTTVYYADGPLDALPLVLLEKSYRLAHATDPLLPEHFQTERNIVLNELRQRDNTAYRARGVLARALYPYGHPYHTSAGGRPRDLLSLQASDMENFMRARQRPNLATLVISGNVDEDRLRGLVTDYFAGIEPGNTFPQRAPDIQLRTVDTSEEIFDSVATPRLYRGWNVPPDGHADLPALMLCADVLTRRLDTALGGDLSLGVAYVDPRELGSQFQIALYLLGDADQGEVEDTLNGLVRSLLEQGPTEVELDSSRRAFISSGARAQASSDAIATAVVHCVDKGNDPDCLNIDVQAWHDATPGLVRDVARQWLAEGSHTLLVTPGNPARSPSGQPGPARNVPWDVGVPDAGLHATPTDVDRTLLPPIPPPGPVDFPVVSRAELPNGLPLVLAPMREGKNAHVVFIFDGGRTGDLDPDIGMGTANAALRVLIQRAGALEGNALERKLNELELTVGARSKEGYSTIVLKGPPANLAEGARLVGDMLTDARFPSDLLEQARAKARTEIGWMAIEPDLRSRVLVDQLVLGEEHPYGADPMGEGTEASLAAMTPGQLAQWVQRYLHPSNATIVAVGPFDTGELSRGLTQAFGAVDGARERSRTDIPRLTQSAHPGMYVLPIDEGQQSHVMLGYPVPRDGSRNDVVGECIDSIIQRRVKRTLREEKGMTYRVDSLATATREVRMGGFTAAVNNAHAIDALATARSVLSDLLEGRAPVTQEELDLHLLYQRRTLATRFRDPLEVESALVETVDLRSHDARIAEAAQLMEGMTSDEVNNALGRMQMGHLTWILAGPAAGDAVESRLQFTAMGLAQFTTVDPGTGARTVHRL